MLFTQPSHIDCIFVIECFPPTSTPKMYLPMRDFYFTIIILILLSSTVTAQDNTSFLFSNTLHRNLKNYSKKSDIAYRNDNIDRANFLFDSLVRHQLIGTTFDDFNLKRFHKGRQRISAFEKPIFLITYASWCVPNKGEIPALNKLARQYGNDIQFIVLYWDRKSNLKKLSKKFDHHIAICYAHETYNKDAYLVSTLKHSLGFPILYYLDKNRTVIAIKRNTALHIPRATYSKALDANYKVFKDNLSCLLNTNDSPILAKN